MKTLKIILVLIMLSATIFANEASDKCDSLQGSWTWNGDENQWQCTNLTDTAKETYASYITAETNITFLVG